MSFKKFISILSETQIPITRFTLGNGSVDYDSFFGSIIFAYILTQTSGHLHQPIIDCPRNQLKLRFEISAVLQKMKISANAFRYRESSSEPYAQGIYNMYDHNKRQNLKNIEYIVDHHEYNPKEISAKKYLIDRMGSGLTLLYYLLSPQKFKDFDQNELKGTQFASKLIDFANNQPFEQLRTKVIIDEDIKEIIRYGIILDTFNLDPKQTSRWTVFDKKALQFIEKQHNFEFGHEWLEQIKYDNQKNLKLSLKQILAKDRKSYNYGKIKCIYSVILIGPQLFYDHYKDQINKQMSTIQGCDIYFIMAAFKDEKKQFRRELIYRVYNKEQGLIQQSLNIGFKGFNLIDRGSLGEWRRLQDLTKTISRKVFQPVIGKLLEKTNSTDL